MPMFFVYFDTLLAYVDKLTKLTGSDQLNLLIKHNNQAITGQLRALQGRFHPKIAPLRVRA